MHSSPYEKLRYETGLSHETDRDISAALERVERARSRLGPLIPKGVLLENVGSTAPDRGTYVADPLAHYKDFRPDVDLNLLLPPKLRLEHEVAELAAVLEELGVSPNQGAHHQHDRIHGKDVYNACQGEVVVSAAVFYPNCQAEYDSMRYNEFLGVVGPHQKIESKIMRLVLQRAAAYGSYNRGISGICIDEIVRIHGDADQALRFLLAAAKDPKKRHVLHPICDGNLLEGVSRHVWFRIALVAQHYLESGLLPGGPLCPKNWAELNPGKFISSGVSSCAIQSCGREPSIISKLIIQGAQQIMGDLKLPGPFDYYIVPCAGLRLQNPHSLVFVALPKFKHISESEVQREFETMIEATEEQG